MIDSRDSIRVRGMLREDGRIEPEVPLPIRPGPVELRVRPTEPPVSLRSRRTVLDMLGVGSSLWQSFDWERSLEAMRDEWDPPRH